LGPRECGSFAQGEPICLSPGDQRRESVDSLAFLECVLPVHGEAIGTAIDLRGADLDQLSQALLDTTGICQLLDTEDRPLGRSRQVRVLKAVFWLLVKIRGCGCGVRYP